MRSRWAKESQAHRGSPVEDRLIARSEVRISVFSIPEQDVQVAATRTLSRRLPVISPEISDRRRCADASA